MQQYTIAGTISVFRSISVASSYTSFIRPVILGPLPSLSSHVLNIGSVRRAFTLGSRTTTNSHGCVLLPESALVAALRIERMTSYGTGYCLNLRTDLSVLIP